MNNAKIAVNICIHWEDWFVPLMLFTAPRTQVDARPNIVIIAAYFLLSSSVRMSSETRFSSIVNINIIARYLITIQ
jgi:hypothetical protein